MSGFNRVDGEFEATGQSASFNPAEDNKGGAKFNLTLSGTFVATVRVERSFDDGDTWHPCTALGATVEFTAPCTETLEEIEADVLYRLNCTSFISGTVTYRLSQ